MPEDDSTTPIRITDIICAALADGHALRAICKQPGMPAQSTVFRWLAADASFRERYARAREVQADRMAEEILEIADDSRHDIQVSEDGTEVVDHEHIARSKLRVDARRWLMGKLAPKKYGDRITTEISGPGGGPVEVASTLTDDARAVAFLFAAAEARLGQSVSDVDEE